MNDIIANAKAGSNLHDALQIVKGFRNGAVYGNDMPKEGAKIRFPHALVLIFNARL